MFSEVQGFAPSTVSLVLIILKNLPQAMKLFLFLESISDENVGRGVSGLETRMIWSKERAVVRGSVGFLISVVFDEFRNRIDVVLRFIMN